MNRLSPANSSATSASARGEAPADQFTIARVAEVLGRDVRTVRQSLSTREADGYGLVSGNAAKTYLVSSLPGDLRLALVELARLRGFDSPERLLARETDRWTHAIPITGIHPEEIARAKKRSLALADAACALCDGIQSVEEIHATAVEVHKRVLGYEVTAPAIDNIIRRALKRDGGRREFHRWEIYLPEVPKVVEQSAVTGDESDFDQVESYRELVDGARATVNDRAWVWTAMCDNLQTLLESGEPLRQARRRLITHVFQRARWVCSSRDSLAKCFDEKWERYCAGERFLGDRRPEQSGHHHALPLTDDDEKLLIARSLGGGIARAWRDALRKGELSSGVCQYFIANPSSKTYVPARVRALIAPKVVALQPIHHGPIQARLNGAYITRDWSGVAAGDWYQSDDCTLPLYYWENGPDGKPRAIRGQFLPMIDLRSNRVLSLALHCDKNYNAKVIRGLIVRTHDTFGLPRKGYYFENGIWRKAKLLKGSGDEIEGEETERGLRDLKVTFKHARKRNPRAKPIERILGLLQTRMEDQPGYCGRDEKTEKFERLQEKLRLAAAGKIEYSSFLLHRDVWTGRLVEICDEYNSEAQEGRLKGLSPREAWEKEFDFQQPLVRLTGAARHLLANHRRPTKVTRNGICVQIGKERHWFRNEATGRLIGQIVQVYFNPEDMSSIWLRNSTSSASAIVVPRAPGAPAMSATDEQFAAASASCKEHNSAVITLYREVATHFPKNGPAHFRPIISTPEFVEATNEVVAQQDAIRGEQQADQQRKKKLSRLQRSLGRIEGSDAVSDERRLAAYEALQP